MSAWEQHCNPTLVATEGLTGKMVKQKLEESEEASHADVWGAERATSAKARWEHAWHVRGTGRLHGCSGVEHREEQWEKNRATWCVQGHFSQSY